jgi:putative transposase
MAWGSGRRIDRRPRGRARIAPFKLLYTDFTELVYANGRKKAHLIPIVDHKSKVAVGWAVGEQAVTEVALEAWKAARQMLSKLGVSWRGVIVHHDQDPVFTSYGWTSRLLLKDRVQLSYALNGAGDNPEIEGFNSRFKTENQSLFNEARTFEELVGILAERFQYYNRERRHSAIGYLAPLSYVKSLKHPTKTKKSLRASQI